MNALKIPDRRSGELPEVPRHLECPKLSRKEIAEITQTLFVAPDPQPADVLFVFGSSYGDNWAQVAELYRMGLAPRVYIAGKMHSRIIRDQLIALGVQDESIVTDERSTNTLEDALFAKDIFEVHRIPHNKILFACKAPHSGRCLRTLKKVFPGCELFPFSYAFMHEGMSITADNWMLERRIQDLVWAEYQRIKLYSSRGDISE